MVSLLGPGDAPAVVRLRREALSSAPFAFAASLEDDRGLSLDFVRASLSDVTNAATFGAFEGDVLVGMVGIVRPEAVKSRHKARIWGMFVEPAAQGRGYGTALLNSAIDRARSWPGVMQVHLEVAESAEVARELYSEAGFTNRSGVMKFEAKKDPWVSALIWGGIVIMALGTIQVVHDALVADSSGADVITAFLLGALLMGSGGIMLWVYFGTNYTLASDRLLIRSGPFRWEIKYTDIKEIRPTRNPLSSPALSLDRLAIRRHTSSIAVMISPLDREAFLRAVRERVPGLEVGLD